ncbi:MAG: hypothetical protein ACRENE_18125 [Polyangiaceae bacterium]
MAHSLAHSEHLEPPPDGELERGILDAVRLGLLDVARTLSAQLEDRRIERAGNVVSLDKRKRRS